MAGVLNNKEENVENLPYFVQHLITITEVIEYLSHFIHIDGAFIVRRSISNRDKLTLSICVKNAVKHILISERHGLYHLSNRRFATVDELVEYYKIHDVPNIEKVEGVRLKVAITEDFQPEYENSEVTAGSNPISVTDSNTNPPPNSYFAMAQKDTITRSTHRHREGKQRSISTTEAPATSPRGSPRPHQGKATQFHLGGRTRAESLNDIDHKKLHNKKDQVSTVRNIRPPPPTPHLSEKVQDEVDHIRQSPEYIARSYATVRNVDIDHAQDLIDQLKVSERCECGLDMSDAQMPKGWTAHKVMESDHRPGVAHVFFVSPNNESSWTLPDDVKLMLNARQKGLLQRLGAPGMLLKS